jgi:hypothetical protein
MHTVPLGSEIEKDILIEDDQEIGRRFKLPTFKLPKFPNIFGGSQPTRPTTRPTTTGSSIQKSGSVFTKGLGMCKRNPKLCLIGLPTAAYVASNHLDASSKTKECMALCLPSNHPEVPSNFQSKESIEALTGEPLQDANKQPFCNIYSGNCDAYCKSECEAIHESIFSTVTGFFGGVGSGVSNLMKNPTLLVTVIIAIILIPIILKAVLAPRPPPVPYY